VTSSSLEVDAVHRRVLAQKKKNIWKGDTRDSITVRAKDREKPKS